MNVQALHPKYVTDDKGIKTEVILPISEYYELLEDLEDLAIVAQRKGEESIPFDEAMKELGLQDHV
ncbi:MAG: hypothetical protein PF447_05570 [Spirochaetaceae bacterium]|nr:hypothetical protein [Spirochaetaceae bacterium]